MDKSLECDLRYFSINEILFLLEKFKKTGKIEIESGESKGEIFIEEGNIIHSSFKNIEGIDAVYQIAQLLEGKLFFYPNVFPNKRTISGSPAVIKEEIEKRNLEIRNLKEKLPPLDTVLVKADTPPSSELTLRKSDWKILTLINGERNLRKVIEESGLGLFEAYKSILFLIEQGLIVDPEESKKATESLLNFLNACAEEIGGELEEEKKKARRYIFDKIKEKIDFPLLVEKLKIEKEFGFVNEINLSFKDVKKIKNKIEEIVKEKLEDTYGKVLAKKKIEILKKKLEK